MKEEMSPDCKEAFISLIKNLTSDNPKAIHYYNSMRCDEKFETHGLTPKGIADLTYGYIVKDYPEIFGLTKKQAVKLRVYVKQNLFDNGLEYVLSKIEKILTDSKSL